jgi:MFS family permease
MPAADRGATQDRSLVRVTLASLAGTTLEFYDHFIYGTAAALVFPKVFFAQMTPELALALSLLTYGIAFVARPLGAIIFGHFGDRIGRKNVLVAALLIMGLATFLIGCLPGYATAGALGAYCLCALRLLQGIALGGEWGGAALMVNECAKDSKHKGLLGSMVQLASPIGFLLASGVFAIITATVSEQAFLSWGWRIPFLASAILVLVGLYVRLSISESPEFMEKKAAADAEESAPIFTVLKNHWRRLLLAIGTRIGSDIAFYVFALFPLVYLPHIGVSKQVALQASIAAALGQACGIPLFGYLCDKFSTRSVLALGAVANLVWAFVFFGLLDLRETGTILAAAFVALFLLAAMWAPLAAHLPRMFPVEVRFTGAGLGFQAAGILGGALAPTICVMLLKDYGSALPVSLYLGSTLVLALLCILLTPAASKR